MEAAPVLGATANEQFANKENLCPGRKNQDVKIRATGQRWVEKKSVKKPLCDSYTKQMTPLYCKDEGCETSSQESGDIGMDKEGPFSPGSGCDYDIWPDNEFTIFIDV